MTFRHKLKSNLTDPHQWSMVINGHPVWFGGPPALQRGVSEQKWTQGPDGSPGCNEISRHKLKSNLTDPHQWSMVINGHPVWFGGPPALQSGVSEQKWTHGPDGSPGCNEISRHKLKSNLTDPHQWSMVINGHLVWFGGAPALQSGASEQKWP